MRPHLLTLLTGMALFMTITPCQAAYRWPKSINTTNGTEIKLYKPQILNYTGSTIQSRFVIAVMSNDQNDPVFGTIWTTAAVTTDSAKRLASINSVHVDYIIVRGDTSREDIRFWSAAIEYHMARVIRSYPLDTVMASLAEQQQDMAYTDMDTVKNAPVIIFRTRPTALVLIDGAPQLLKNEAWGVDAVTNSPFVIVQDKDRGFYLYGGGHWYVAPDATGPYAYTNDEVSRRLRKIARGFKKAARKDGLGEQTDDMGLAPVYDIVVSTVPAVLVQSSGDPQPEPIVGTSLVYVNNSEDIIFFDTATHVYYVETGGKWYQSNRLQDSSGWRQVQAPQFPADFAKIPAQSPKAEVLANVPGTAAANDAAREESVPDVQKVDRSVTTNVGYDGPPMFSPIEGTRLQYATNTCAIVLFQNGLYYTLDDGVWFVAGTPLGVWRVSDSRPPDVGLIPRLHPAYRSRFVYIYQSRRDYVWEGYLPGYLDDPSGGCGLAETDDYSGVDQAWCFDLDFVFGWGGGWYSGYYWLDRHHRFYGSGGLGGKWAHWDRWQGIGARKWNGGAWANRGQWHPRRSSTFTGSHPVARTSTSSSTTSRSTTSWSTLSRSTTSRSSVTSGSAPGGNVAHGTVSRGANTSGGGRFNVSSGSRGGGGYSGGGSHSSGGGGNSGGGHVSSGGGGAGGGGGGSHAGGGSSGGAGGGGGGGGGGHH